MNERIKKLREQSLRIHPYISMERASLLTDFYQSGETRGVSNPVMRALAFRYIMENNAVRFNEGELIVGERGTAPRATPTYPEITVHSLKNLEILDSREKTSYYVDEETRELYEKKIIPYWKERSIRERIFKEVSQEWKDAFEAGVFTAKSKPPPLEVVYNISKKINSKAMPLKAFWLGNHHLLCRWSFTEFMEQRAPGHTVLDDKIYKKGLEDRSLTEESARELLQAFWIKFNNQPAPPKVGVTAEESGTYTDFTLINSGGVKADGSDAVNELTYLILDVIEEMRILQPGSMIQLSKKNPDRFLKRALKIIKTGFGQPSIFNADVIVQELVRQGKSIEDARNGGASGCVEAGAFGKENYSLTGYFNLVKVLEITLHNGTDPGTGKKIGIETGDPADFRSFIDLFKAFERQVNYFVDIKIEGSNIIDRIFAEYIPAPFLSILIDDCIAEGKDYHDGGARYNTNYIQGVGLGSITDILTSIKYNVFDKEHLSMEELLEILKNNFKNNETLRQRFLNRTPKFGNDDDYADDIIRSVFEIYYNAVNGRPNTRGGCFRINLLPTTVHVYFGRVVGATADGRKASEPLSEGISPVQGADRHGPTAVIKSVSKIDHDRTGGTLLNQKFIPQLLADEEGIDKVARLVRSYFSPDGHHIQMNVVTADTRRAAQKNPEKHRDLIVRVAGYSDYFCDLNTGLQNEIIARTEHESV